MFSDRLYLLIEYILYFGRSFGSSVLGFDHIKLLYYNATDPKFYKRLKRNYLWCCLWAMLSITILAKYHMEGDIIRYNVSLTCWFALLILLFLYTIMFVYYETLVYVANGTVKFFLKIQRKSNSYPMYSQVLYLSNTRTSFCYYFRFLRYIHAWMQSQQK